MQGTIRRRGSNAWEIRFDLPRGPDGRRRRQHLTVRGKRADAERRMREALAALDRGLPLDTRKVLVRDFLERWLADYAVPNTRPRTSERYASDIRLHISPALGHLQLAQLRPADIQTFEARLIEQGMSRRSVRHVHVVLKQALKHAVRWGLIHYNVAEAVDPPKSSAKEIQPPDVAQVNSILRLADETPYGVVLAFMARTGCRRSEALGLRWVDIDLDVGMASILRSLQRVGKQGLVFQPPKSAKSRRRIALDGRTVEILRAHQGAQMLAKAEIGKTFADQGLVFPGPLGKPLDPATLTRNFIKLVKRAGLSGVRLHDLRHFHASVLLKNDTHLKVVQERLGHASIATTGNIYSHVAPSMQAGAAETFAAAMDAEGL